MQSAVGQPNIIFIIADDLGSADLGCYGGASVSPVIRAKQARTVAPRIELAPRPEPFGRALKIKRRIAVLFCCISPNCVKLGQLGCQGAAEPGNPE